MSHNRAIEERSSRWMRYQEAGLQNLLRRDLGQADPTRDKQAEHHLRSGLQELHLIEPRRTYSGSRVHRRTRIPRPRLRTRSEGRCFVWTRIPRPRMLARNKIRCFDWTRIPRPRMLSRRHETPARWNRKWRSQKRVQEKQMSANQERMTQLEAGRLQLARMMDNQLAQNQTIENLRRQVETSSCTISSSIAIKQRTAAAATANATTDHLSDWD